MILAGTKQNGYIHIKYTMPLEMQSHDTWLIVLP